MDCQLFCGSAFLLLFPQVVHISWLMLLLIVKVYGFFVFFYPCRSVVGLNAVSATANPDDFKASILFKALEMAMADDKDNLIEKFRGIYAFKVKNGPGGAEGYWVINAKTGSGSVEFNGKGNFY